MNQIIIRAYNKIFNQGPPADTQDWQAAEKILNNFSVPKLNEELAEQFLVEVILRIEYPDQETTSRLVGRAEGLIGELREDLPDEPHMAEIERSEYLKEQKKHAR